MRRMTRTGRPRRIKIAPGAPDGWQMPTSVYWPCMGGTYKINTEISMESRGTAEIDRTEHQLTFLVPNPSDFVQMHAFAAQILPKFAKATLARIVAETASECKFELPVKFSCRFCRSRWGSWSSENHMMLNAILIFTEPETVKSVIIHEFCHRTHPDHSRDFWNMVYSYCPDYDKHHAVLKTLMTDIDPLWRS